MWLRRCTGQPGLVKLWRDESTGSVCLMFEKESDQAKVFIVGLKDTIIRLQDSSRILVEEITHSQWMTEFHDPRHPSPIPFSDFYDRYIAPQSTQVGFFAELASSTGAEGRIAPYSTQGSSQAGGGTNFFGKNEASGSNQATSSGGESQVATKDHVHDDAKAKKVEVELAIRGQAGANVVRILRLFEAGSCKIDSLIKLQFTQQSNEEEKILEVTLETEFKIPQDAVICRAGLDNRVGVLHDNLSCSYHAQEANSLILVKHRPVGLSSFDLAEKMTSSSSKGVTLGGEIGLPPKLATAKITGAFSKMLGMGSESSSCRNLDSIQGTMFVVSPLFNPKVGDNTLSYVARHQIPLQGLKFKDSGLSRDKGKVVSPSMSMGKSTSLECHGLFWVMDSSIQSHLFKASRNLGEYKLSEPDKKFTEELIIGEETLEKALLVNHGFDWALFDGRVFRRLLGSTRGGSYSSSIAGLMDFP